MSRLYLNVRLLHWANKSYNSISASPCSTPVQTLLCTSALWGKINHPLVCFPAASRWTKERPQPERWVIGSAASTCAVVCHSLQHLGCDHGFAECLSRPFLFTHSDMYRSGGTSVEFCTHTPSPVMPKIQLVRLAGGLRWLFNQVGLKPNFLLQSDNQEGVILISAAAINQPELLRPQYSLINRNIYALTGGGVVVMVTSSA